MRRQPRSKWQTLKQFMIWYYRGEEPTPGQLISLGYFLRRNLSRHFKRMRRVNGRGKRTYGPMHVEPLKRLIPRWESEWDAKLVQRFLALK